ncbi:hypothetical protein EDD16DRAFT_422990 [Pisolithus croceorrhizus]|nr:hypothetical protein EDD16DRAFT_422990 [Pisolithus croceorrhizus]KAI6159371.1 hypothetical protein EDD17DRAFT_900951 [Pisolithus thermaeus]
MFPQSQFSTLVSAPMEPDAPGCYLHDRPVSSHCLPPPGNFPGRQILFLLPDGSICYGVPLEVKGQPTFVYHAASSTLITISQQPYVLDTSTVPAPSRFYVNYSNAAAAFGLEDGMRSTANYYSMPLESSYPPDVGFVAPAQSSPSIASFQTTGVNIPAGHSTLAQGYSGQFGSHASAVATPSASMGTLSSANLASSPLEVSQAHSFPAPLAGSASPVPSQGASRSSDDPRRCQWKDNQGNICGELVGWNCQGHLASAHEIVNISSDKSVKCGACGEEKKRKFILRHNRERHLGFRRQKRNAA